MDPLRVKWWGPKHLTSYYFCELSLHPKFQSPSITLSYKKAGDSGERKIERKKNDDFNGHLVPDWLCQKGLSVSLLRRRESADARAKIDLFLMEVQIPQMSDQGVDRSVH